MLAMNSILLSGIFPGLNLILSEVSAQGAVVERRTQGIAEDPTMEGLRGWTDVMWPIWGSTEYYDSLKLNYKFRNQKVLNEDKDIYFQTKLRIDPCRDFLKTGGAGDRCCSDTNDVGCQDHTSDIMGGTDLQVAYFQNSHIPSCDGTPFEKDPNCGSTLEIHRRNRAVPIVADVRIKNDVPDGFQTIYIGSGRPDLPDLCVGEYELWLVVRTRGGPFVLARKDFSVKGPSCREVRASDIELFQRLVGRVFEDAEDVSNLESIMVPGRRELQQKLGQNATSTASSRLQSTVETSANELDAKREMNYLGRNDESRELYDTTIDVHAPDYQVTEETREEKLIKELNRQAEENRRQGYVMGSVEWKERIEKEKERYIKHGMRNSD